MYFLYQIVISRMREIKVSSLKSSSFQICNLNIYCVTILNVYSGLKFPEAFISTPKYHKDPIMILLGR